MQLATETPNLSKALSRAPGIIRNRPCSFRKSLEDPGKHIGTWKLPEKG